MFGNGKGVLFEGVEIVDLQEETTGSGFGIISYNKFFLTFPPKPPIIKDK